MKIKKKDEAICLILQSKITGTKPLWQDISSKDEFVKIYCSQWDSFVVNNGVLFREWICPDLQSKVLQVVVPRQMASEILKESHDSPTGGGHFGINKTLDKIRKRFYWATCKKDVENWCKSCEVWISRKGSLDKGTSKMQIYNSGLPFERIQMDILGPFPSSSAGNKYLLVIIDTFTKWVEAFPLSNMRTKTIAEVFVTQIVSRYGVPLEVHTDQGKNFDSRLVKQLANLIGIRKTRTTPLHPRSNGQVERQHHTILDYLAKYVSDNQKDWDRWISLFLLVYRSSRHEITGASPAAMYTGSDLRLPLDLIRGCPPGSGQVKTFGDYVQKLQMKMNDIHKMVRTKMNIQSHKTKSWYDKRARNIDFQEGLKVWFFNPQRRKGKSPKLQCNWDGPYTIKRKINDVVFCIQKSPRSKNKIVHSDRLATFTERIA